MKRRLWTLLFALPLLLGLGLALWRSGEDALVARAGRRLAAGKWEAALATLRQVRARPLLSGAGRRRAAELFLRLGEDADGHALLRGQRFEESDPEDRSLRELTGRNLRAARLVARADAERDPERRLRHLRAAQIELPEAPRLLQRVTIEELGAILVARSPNEAQARSEAYLQDYQELRKKAPGLAEEVRARALELQDRLAGRVIQ